MKTEVIMKREIFGQEISQKSQSGFFSATDLVNAGNVWRMANNKKIFNFSMWLKNVNTKIFIEELETEFKEKVMIKKSKTSQTWVHPFLFIDLALAISPKLKIQVYKWLHDHLLKYRNFSGDSYKKMTGALYVNQKNKLNFSNDIKLIAEKIKSACKVEDWQTAGEKQLELRDKIHNNIALLCNVLRENKRAVDIGINQALENKYE